MENWNVFCLHCYTVLWNLEFAEPVVPSTVHIKPHHFKTKMSAASWSNTSLEDIFDHSKSLRLQVFIHPFTEVTVTMPQGATCSLGEITNDTHPYTKNAASGPIWDSVSYSRTLQHEDCRSPEFSHQLPQLIVFIHIIQYVQRCDIVSTNY